MHIHPEGRPYFQDDKFVTSDDMQNLEIRSRISQALGLIFYMLKHMKATKQGFTFHQEVEFCIELETITSPPEFNYYIVDHKERKIFWADNRQPADVEGTEGAARGACA
jgi:hypothetical protein